MVALLAHCGRSRVDEHPDTAVRELVESLRGPTADPTRLKTAYGLLSARARENLQARAQRYTAASGKAIVPEAMLAPPGALLAFEPRQFRVVRTEAAVADVEVSGLLEEEVVSVHCVKEDGVWRVDIALPPLPPIQHRPGAAHK